MRYITFISILLILSRVSNASVIIPPHDVSYLGAFTVPQGTVGSSWFGFSGNTIAYNPDGNGGTGSLFIEGSASQQKIAEISIPSLKSGVDKSQLNISNVLQSFTDITGGRASGGTYPKMSLTYIPQTGNMTSPRLLWTAIDAYQCDQSTGFMGWSSTVFGSVDGSWVLNGHTNCDNGGYIYSFLVPQSWADTYTGGKNLIMGGARVAASGSWGPAFYAVANPATLSDHPANGTTLSNTQLSYYTQAHPVNNYAVSSYGDYGAAWVSVGSKAAVVVSHRRSLREFNVPDYLASWGGESQVRWPYETYKGVAAGTGRCDTGNGADYCPECSQYGFNPGGPQAFPYIGEIAFYNPSDLAAVYAGTKQAYEPQPYAVMSMAPYFYQTQAPSLENVPMTIGGIAYDDANHRLFVVETFGMYPEVYPVIHVFSVSDSGKSAIDNTPPTAVSSAANNAGAVSWSPSTGNDNGGTLYVVLKNYNSNGNNISDCSLITGNFWKPVYITKNTSWSDPYYSNTASFEANHEYQVVVMDALGQISNASTSSSGGDIIPPTITAFTMPSTATSTTVPVSSFTASDSVGVTGFCITTVNSSSGCSWSGSAPTTVTGSAGANTWYAWAKDAAGNVSAASTAATTITLTGGVVARVNGRINGSLK